MSENKVRVRFAPSPTGPLHLGGVRTALYNYLFAKKHSGDFILRIEDTDQTRFVEGAEQYIIDSLTWCGITPDEGPHTAGNFGPYRQSDRKPMYRDYAIQLVESGHAYYAFDTSEELEEMRAMAKKAKMANWQYNNITRMSMKNSLTLPEDEVATRINSGESYTVRIKTPRNEEIRFQDIIRGWVSVNSNNMDDKVILKADNMPTYHLANVVDDYLMKISHVIRGEEWLPSAPLHVLLYKYLGWTENTPQFAHLPLILKPDGNGKLSKRDGDRLGFPVFPLNWLTQEGETYSGYRDQGYFPEAFVNMLAFLGWNPGTPEEIFSLEELVKAFTLDRVSKSGAKFDPEKAKWYNQQYLRSKSDQELAKLLMPLVDTEIPEEKLARIASLMKERASFINDLLEVDYLFDAPKTFDEKTIRKKWKDSSAEIMQNLATHFDSITNFEAEKIEASFKEFLQQTELGMGTVLPLFRLLVTGKAMGPSMFEISELVGKQETLNRLRSGIAIVSEV